jgi:hypothetical protein
MTPLDDQPIERICRGCGGKFVITPGEVRFFVDNNLHLPWRCQPCRDERRATRRYVTGLSDDPS